MTHGAIRKSCSHPNCNKAAHVKGYCSAHGPSSHPNCGKRVRPKCSHPDCDNLVVKGGVCVTMNVIAFDDTTFRIRKLSHVTYLELDLRLGEEFRLTLPGDRIKTVLATSDDPGRSANPNLL